MSDNVIRIRFSTDLETPARNRLRYAMEMCEWRKQMREAKPDPDDSSTWDWDALERLDRQFELVGLP